MVEEKSDKLKEMRMKHLQDLKSKKRKDRSFVEVMTQYQTIDNEILYPHKKIRLTKV